MTSAGRITVIICTFNRAGLLESTLEALVPQLGTPVLARVIVVDNGSADETGQVIERYAQRYPAVITGLYEPRPGKTNALNTAIEASTSPVLAFMDDDVLVSHDWLSEIARTMDAYPQCDVFGGRVKPTRPEGHDMPDWVHWADPFNTAEGPLCDHDKGDGVRSYSEAGMCTPIGANVVVRTSVFERYGLFDTSQEGKGGVPRSEDSVYFNRLKKQGVCMLYVPTIFVSHVTDPLRLTKRYFRNYFRKSAKSVVRASHRREAGTRVFNVPWHFYRRLVFRGWLWAMAWLRCEAKSLRFARELDFIYLSAIVGEYLRIYREDAA